MAVILSFELGGCARDAAILVSLADPEGLAAGAEILAIGRTLETLSEARRIDTLRFPVSFIVKGEEGIALDMFAEVRGKNDRVLGRTHAELMFANGHVPRMSLSLQRACFVGSECDDGLFCNGEERMCAQGICVRVASPCVASLPCRVVTGCNESEDQCLFGDTPDVDDGDPCTDDVCTLEGPRHTSIVDDGDPCTNDVCTVDGPRHTPNVDDGDPCTEDTCTVEGPQHTSIVDDGDPCTEDTCTGEGAMHVEKPELCGMVFVPAGPFWMGCDAPTCAPHEYPLRNVQLSAFDIDRTEVTKHAYDACVRAKVCASPRCDWDPSDRPDYPVVCVDWNDAMTYCAWRRKRLPTEAEWEKAARGSDARIYPWGNAAPTCALAVYEGCGDQPRMAGEDDRASGASPYGARDMAGNVWEWVSDWYGPYDAWALTNPTGPTTGAVRVLRGGDYYTARDSLRASYRRNIAPDFREYLVGFRCAR